MKLHLVLLLLIIGIEVHAQDNGVWNTLSMVTVTSEYDVDYGYEIQKIEVSPLVEALAKKEIEVSGYIIPLTGQIEQSHFMLSSLPANMCFFCGKAGPETAMQVFMKDGKKLPFQEDKIRVKGQLIVNPNSDNQILYTLEDAILVE